MNATVWHAFFWALAAAEVSSSEVAFLFYVTMVTPLQGTAAPGAAPIAAFCAVALSMSPLAAGTPATTALRAGVNEVPWHSLIFLTISGIVALALFEI